MFRNYKKFSYNKIINLIRKSFSMNQSLLYNEETDYYKILEVRDKASAEEIKNSYLCLSMKHHPDKGGNEEEFKKINTAYEVMKNQESRNVYNRLRDEYNKDIETKINTKSSNERDRTRKYHEKDYEQYHYRKNEKSEKSHQYREKEFFHSNVYEEYVEMLRKHYEKEFRQKNNKKSEFEKFKSYYKYTPTKDVQYPEFLMTIHNVHHIQNRISPYQSTKLIKYIEKGINPFEIRNNFDIDKDFIQSINKSEKDDERQDKRISFKDLKSVYSKFSIRLFILVNLAIFVNLFIL
jgi:curved DNA-binding protein CbpA